MDEMTKALVKTKKVGGSIMVTIPSNIIKAENIEEDEFIEIEVKKKRFNGLGALRGIGPYIREEDRAKDRL